MSPCILQVLVVCWKHKDCDHWRQHIVNADNKVVITASSNESVIPIAALRAGKTHIQFQYLHSNSAHAIVNLSLVGREVAIVHWYPLCVITDITGWLYFAAWSLAFIPQIFLNFRRKSVVGLNFDFLAYNLIGFLSYCVFNIGLYWIPEVQREYLSQNPGEVIQVKMNDVAFSIYAVLLTALTIFQCFIYERGGQRLSVIGILLSAAMWLFLIISLFVAVGGKLSWLLFIYFTSYVKLFVTIIKYTPQAWMNFRRKSTVCWSIGNVLLDFTGGSFSILQMFLISYNYDDWKSIFGDPTKFGLGFFSICFDLLFMFQHYVLYRKPLGRNVTGTEKEPLLAEKEEKRKHFLSTQYCDPAVQN